MNSEPWFMFAKRIELLSPTSMSGSLFERATSVGIIWRSDFVATKLMLWPCWGKYKNEASPHVCVNLGADIVHLGLVTMRTLHWQKPQHFLQLW